MVNDGLMLTWKLRRLHLLFGNRRFRRCFVGLLFFTQLLLGVAVVGMSFRLALTVIVGHDRLHNGRNRV